jgi:hypothetical protein
MRAGSSVPNRGPNATAEGIAETAKRAYDLDYHDPVEPVQTEPE